MVHAAGRPETHGLLASDRLEVLWSEPKFRTMKNAKELRRRILSSLTTECQNTDEIGRSAGVTQMKAYYLLRDLVLMGLAQYCPRKGYRLKQEGAGSGADPMLMTVAERVLDSLTDHTCKPKTTAENLDLTIKQVENAILRIRSWGVPIQNVWGQGYKLPDGTSPADFQHLMPKVSTDDLI